VVVEKSRSAQVLKIKKKLNQLRLNSTFRSLILSFTIGGELLMRNTTL